MEVGRNIKFKREAAGLTQEELAKKVGVTAAMICQIERGTKNPSLQVGTLIAEALGCDVAELTR